MAMTAAPWHLKGTYFESCNCDSVCPCRPQGDRPGGLSDTGECIWALSWLMAEGHADDLDLSGFGVVMAGRYWDERHPQPPRPIGTFWDVVLYVDDRASDAQAAALADIFLGRAGGDTLRNFAFLIGEVNAIRRSAIQLDHTPGRQRIEVDGRVTVRAREPAPGSERVSCAVPGHEHSGTELVIEINRVDDAPLVWELSGNTGFAADFEYSGEGK